jgi:hypothetical protein
VRFEEAGLDARAVLRKGESRKDIPCWGCRRLERSGRAAVGLGALRSKQT